MDKKIDLDEKAQSASTDIKLKPEVANGMIQLLEEY